MPKKSIFRGPDAQHFQLVHRSQRDPLLHDPEAGGQVLKPVERGNDLKKGTTLAELDASLDKSKMRANEGEAATYGITYDDSEYDYMAHLRPVQGGWDSVMIPAPRGSGVAPGMKTDRKGKSKELFVDDNVLASRNEMSLDQVYSAQSSIPEELQGLQPDMDPHLRQVLEALDDDAFVEEEDEEQEGEDGEWWGELLGGGEAEEWEERPDFEFAEWGVDEDEAPELVEQEDKEETWEDRFKAFKKAQKDGAVKAGSDGSDGQVPRSQIAESISSLVSGVEDLVVKGGKKRHGKRGPSDATGMSMSSSSMFRTQGLRDLDARFDKVERDYDIEEEDEDWDDSASTVSGLSTATGMTGMSGMSSSSRSSLYSNSSAAPPEVSREDFDAILDDFLDNYEVVGRRMQPALGGTGLSGAEKLQVLRAAVEGEGEERDANRDLVLEIERLGRGKRAPKEKKERVKEDVKDDKWDVETILTTYTNTENHPAVIGTRSAREKRQRAEEAAKAALATQEAEEQDEEEDDSGSDTETEAPKVTVARPKGETAEEKKARKSAVKAERSARRAEKKAHSATFGEERRKQLASHRKAVGDGKAADVAAGTPGPNGRHTAICLSRRYRQGSLAPSATPGLAPLNTLAIAIERSFSSSYLLHTLVARSKLQTTSSSTYTAQNTQGQLNNMVLAVDLLNRPADVNARTYKLKKIVPEPNSFFMDVKCPGCFQITTVFSHATTVVQCGNCATVLCQPSGGKAKLTEGCSFRRKN